MTDRHYGVRERGVKHRAGMESVASEHLRPEWISGLNPEGSLAALDRYDPDRVEDPATPAEGIGEGPGERREVLERGNAKEADLCPWSGGEDRIEQRLPAETRSAVQILQVVDTDGDEHEISVREGFGRDESDDDALWCGRVGIAGGMVDWRRADP